MKKKNNKFKRRKIKLAVSEICDSLNTQLKTARNNLNKAKNERDKFYDTEKYKKLFNEYSNADLFLEYAYKFKVLYDRLEKKGTDMVAFVRYNSKNLLQRIEKIEANMKNLPEDSPKYTDLQYQRNLLWNKNNFLNNILAKIEENPDKFSDKFYDKQIEQLKENKQKFFDNYKSELLKYTQPVKDAQDKVDNLRKQIEDNDCP